MFYLLNSAYFALKLVQNDGHGSDAGHARSVDGDRAEWWVLKWFSNRCSAPWWSFSVRQSSYLPFLSGENKNTLKFSDGKVCKSFLIGCCPHDILASTVSLILTDCRSPQTYRLFFHFAMCILPIPNWKKTIILGPSQNWWCGEIVSSRLWIQLWSVKW